MITWYLNLALLLSYCSCYITLTFNKIICTFVKNGLKKKIHLLVKFTEHGYDYYSNNLSWYSLLKLF